MSEAVPTSSTNSIRNAKFWITVVLLVIALLATTQYLLSQRVQMFVETSAAEINISGRQRMLSQQIAMLGLKLRLETDPEQRVATRLRLRESIEQMESAHRSLMYGDIQLGVAAPKSEVLRDMYFSHPDGLDIEVTEFLKNARHLLEPVSNARSAQAVSNVVAASRSILTKLNAAVRQYQMDAEKRYVNMNRISDLGLLLTFLVLLLSGYFVFRPMIGRLDAILVRNKEISDELRMANIQLSEKITSLDSLRVALDSHALVSIIDQHGSIVESNQKFCEVSGWSPEALRGKAYFTVAADYSGVYTADSIWDVISDGRVWHGEIKCKALADSFYWVDSTIVPFVNDAGHAVQYIVVSNDITERIQAGEAAVKANRAKSEFLSSMSHELRTPLNSVIGFSQILAMDELTHDQKESVKYINKAGEHLLELINQVLDLSKIETDNLTLSIEPVDPVPVIENALKMTASMAAKAKINFDLKTIGEKLPMVQADHVRFKQILLNIVSNAIKYNKLGGSVTISTQQSRPGFLRFLVADTGKGIPEDLAKDVFVPFQRLGQEGGEIEGTGIGLSISRELTLKMGGDIGFFENSRNGTTFWFELPLAEEPVASPDELPEPESVEKPVAESGWHEVAENQKTVLYIEDNPANLKLMEKVFKSRDSFNLQSAHTAELGLEMAETVHPDLIFMDVNLPGIDGVEAVRRLKQNTATYHIPVVAVSAAAMRSDIKRGMEAGFTEYLTKPIDIAEVHRVLDELQADD